MWKPLCFGKPHESIHLCTGLIQPGSSFAQDWLHQPPANGTSASAEGFTGRGTSVWQLDLGQQVHVQEISDQNLWV